MTFSWPNGMSPRDQAEYMAMLGVDIPTDDEPDEDEEPWVAASSFCESEDPLSGAVCTLEPGHPEGHRDVSEPMVVISWKEQPELLLAGAPIDGAW